MSNMRRLFSRYGQSIWLDYIDRNLVAGEGLKALVADGVRGVTSNPTIFHGAIVNSADYDDSIRDLLQADPGMDDATLYQWLAIQDIQMAADILQPVYMNSHGLDGFVSMEVSPHLAFDTNATIEAARHLWHAVDRANLMIKVPGTVPGLMAVERLIAEGINVNVTLLFSVERYKAVTEAYLEGLRQNPRPKNVASVASFFVSRVDTKVDRRLDEVGTPEALQLKGEIAIANARMAYRYFTELCESERFRVQEQRGARPQRLLWASTGTKNPVYSDLLYLEGLIGNDTVNTLPPHTLDALQDHGNLHVSLDGDVDTADRQLDSLESLGINMAQVTQELEQEGVRKFVDSHDALLAALAEKRFAVAGRYAEQS